MDRTRCWRKAPGSIPYEVPTPNNEDPLAGPYMEHRSRATHRPLPSIGPRHASPERCLWTHRQALWSHASSPSTPVSRWLISRTPSWSRLEASSRPSKQPMDRLGPQGQQHTTSWFVEAIHRARSLGGDAAVLADYALTTTSDVVRQLCQWLLQHRQAEVMEPRNTFLMFIIHDQLQMLAIFINCGVNLCLPLLKRLAVVHLIWHGPSR